MMTPRTNPFRTSKLDSLPFRSVDWNRICARLEELNFRGAIIGPHGTGKTTFLFELQTHLERKLGIPVPYIHLAEKPFPSLHFLWSLATIRSPVCIVDDGVAEGNQLWWSLVWRIAKIVLGERGLIVSAHRPVPLPTIFTTRVNPPLFLELARKLKPEMTEEDRKVCDEILSCCNGNMREAFLELYDREFEIARVAP